MHFKLLVVFTEDAKSDAIMEAAREAGATGATLINQAVGEGVKKTRTFFGLTLDTQRDVILFVVEEHMSRRILEKIAEVGEFDSRPGTGIAVQIDIEDALGVRHQIEQLTAQVEKTL